MTACLSLHILNFLALQFNYELSKRLATATAESILSARLLLSNSRFLSPITWTRIAPKMRCMSHPRRTCDFRVSRLSSRWAFFSGSAVCCFLVALTSELKSLSVCHASHRTMSWPPFSWPHLCLHSCLILFRLFSVSSLVSSTTKAMYSLSFFQSKWNFICDSLSLPLIITSPKLVAPSSWQRRWQFLFYPDFI